MTLAAEHRVEAPGAQPPGNGQQVVVEIAPAAGICELDRHAHHQLEYKVIACIRKCRADERLDLVEVGAEPPLIRVSELLPAFENGRSWQDPRRRGGSVEDDRHSRIVSDTQTKSVRLRARDDRSSGPLPRR